MNCTLTPVNYPSRKVRAVAVYQNVGFVASEDASAKRKAFYAERATSGSFDTQFVFVSWTELNSFLNWLRGYLERVTNPHAANVGPVTVTLPSRKMIKIGVPNGGLVYDDAVGSLQYSLHMKWLGTSDPVGDIGRTDGIVSFFKASTNNPESRWFYPPSIPLDGSKAYNSSDPGEVGDSDRDYLGAFNPSKSITDFIGKVNPFG